MEVVDKIPVILEPSAICSKLFPNKKGRRFSDIVEMLEVANTLIEAKAVYDATCISHVSDDSVKLSGIEFTSRVLAMNLSKAGKVFPYILTIGRKLEEEARRFNLLKRFYLEAIGDAALNDARHRLEEHLKSKYVTGQLSSMNPGSLEDWPITQQAHLFSLFRGVEQAIDVRLTPECCMIPRKSTSGILFPTEVKFYSCQLCPRAKCDSRQAPYDPLLKEKYQKTRHQ